MSLDELQGSLDFGALEVLDEPSHPDLGHYDRFLVFFSGGKDSVACVLHLLEQGVAPERIELHHHDVDGREGSTLMDWPCTPSYMDAFAKAFGFVLNYSWKEGGFEREMLRDGAATAPSIIPLDDGELKKVGGDGPDGVRLKFPQVSASLTTRWCSSYAKIMVGAAYINHHPKFLRGKTLVVTGERAQESSSRARYARFEPHRCDNRTGARVKRWIDHWRPVHSWTEQQVWEIIERHRVAPHPAYILGWGRTSCMKCIFGSADQWASVKRIDPSGFEKISRYEQRFKVTIHRTRSVEEQARIGTPYAMRQEDIDVAMSRTYAGPIIVSDWKLPAGAYGEACGPT